MNAAERKALVALPISILLGLLVAVAGSQGGASIAGVPLFAISVGLAFILQWLAFIPAYALQTEKFFDLTGSVTYIAVITTAFILVTDADGRSTLLVALVVVWAIRLGTFLFRRIRRAGKDDRFDDIKPSFIRFLNVWTIQGVWVTFTIAAALAAITTTSKKEGDWLAVVGVLVWAVGFAIEVVADSQKSRFSANPSNKGKFIRTGLWSRSRHPNYLGEIILWIGVAVIAFPVLQGWQLVTLMSPVFVAVLLTRVSGIPLLEQKADRKWGGQRDYEAYKEQTPVLMPRLRL
jgi:steroid 5-alpha reductase family enzyme